MIALQSFYPFAPTRPWNRPLCTLKFNVECFISKLLSQLEVSKATRALCKHGFYKNSLVFSQATRTQREETKVSDLLEFQKVAMLVCSKTDSIPNQQDMGGITFQESRLSSSGALMIKKRGKGTYSAHCLWSNMFSYWSTLTLRLCSHVHLPVLNVASITPKKYASKQVAWLGL